MVPVVPADTERTAVGATAIRSSPIGPVDDGEEIEGLGGPSGPAMDPRGAVDLAVVDRRIQRLRALARRGPLAAGARRRRGGRPGHHTAAGRSMAGVPPPP